MEGSENKVEDNQNKVVGDKNLVKGSANSVEGEKALVLGDENKVNGKDNVVDGNKNSVLGSENKVAEIKLSDLTQIQNMLKIMSKSTAYKYVPKWPMLKPLK